MAKKPGAEPGIRADPRDAAAKSARECDRVVIRALRADARRHGIVSDLAELPLSSVGKLL
jgi:hypothetical protein